MTRQIKSTNNLVHLYAGGIFFLLLSITLAACNAQPTNPTYPEDPTGFFPTLSDPAGARRPGGGGGGNPDRRGMSFELITDLPIEDIHRHYAEQLETEGWVSISENLEANQVTSYWERQTDTGQVWPAILEITTDPVIAEATYSVELRAVLPP